MRIGQGYDVHKLVENRALILGGVTIDYPLGLLGHSDADVLTHAIMDALLGAAGLGDVGLHFPDSDAKYQDANSLELLKQVCALLREKNLAVGNIDSTIIAQRPNLANYMPAMRDNLAVACDISPKQVNVKATTEEGLGFTGSGEGIAAQAIVLLVEGEF